MAQFVEHMPPKLVDWVPFLLGSYWRLEKWYLLNTDWWKGAVEFWRSISSAAWQTYLNRNKL